MSRQRIAVVGAGVAGLSAAWLLRERFEVTLFEAEARAGGHADTQSVDVGGAPVDVDTGFIVCNDATYPNLLGLFAHLGIALTATEMSFAVSAADGRMEYGGGNLRQVFAQARNLLRPRFWRMLRDIMRFYREAPAVLQTAGSESLGEWLDAHGYGAGFAEDHILPMGAAIWSASVAGIRAFPMRHFVRFFVNHGLLQLKDRPVWRTVRGGSKVYVRRVLADLGDVRLASRVLGIRRGADGVRVRTDAGETLYDQAVLACHADESLAMLDDASARETALLGAIRFQDNRAVLHTDIALMPKRRAVWSAWNYLSDGAQDHDAAISVTYWMNLLQRLETPAPLLVSLNPLRAPDPALVLMDKVYRHPQFDAAAMDAQARLGEIQGAGGVWFAGAWTGWGFHEDGIASAVKVARALGVNPPWAASGRAA